MSGSVPVYLEKGAKRTFAGALDWAGWCRSGRTESEALEALVAYAPRYAAAIRNGRLGFKAPRDASGLEVVERLKGNATTDFGAPAIAPKGDAGRIDTPKQKKLASLMSSAWQAFDAAAAAGEGAELRKGPRGGGRELDAIVNHVYDADAAYLTKIGGKAEKSADMKELRDVILEVFSIRARGESPSRVPRSGKLWSPTYFVRRSAWHALDHAWEIEDRKT